MSGAFGLLDLHDADLVEPDIIKNRCPERE
jgi:hypothetical protein